MSDFWILFIAAILSIIAAYGLGFQVGYHRGYRHKYYEDLLEHANNITEVKTNGDN